MTRWANKVGPMNALPEYPRPQMVRKEWMSLNDVWGFDLADEFAGRPVGDELPLRILVPFPVESALSGIMQQAERVWYRRIFEVPDSWQGRRILLHFGAVDWEASVYINGKSFGIHRGGYSAFSFDITDALKPMGPQELVVGVFDPTDSALQPRGKQSVNPKGIWYTSVTGIWQTVWLEPVPEVSIRDLRLVPDIDDGVLRATVHKHRDASGHSIRLVAYAGADQMSSVHGTPGLEVRLPIPTPKLWSPDNPFLYSLKVTLLV